MKSKTLTSRSISGARSMHAPPSKSRAGRAECGFGVVVSTVRQLKSKGYVSRWVGRPPSLDEEERRERPKCAWVRW